MTTRRRLLQTAVLSPAAALAATSTTVTAVSPSSLYASLGIKPVINGVGVVTVLGGSIMPPEVIRAMEEASRSSSRCRSWKRKWAPASRSC